MFFRFCRSWPKRIFWYLSQHISWEKIICQPRCVSPFPYMSMYVRWRLIIDVCKPRSFWSPSTQSLYWGFVEFSIVRFVMKPSGLYGQPVFGGKKKEHNFTFMWQLHCAIYTIDLSSVHTLCPTELVSLFFFFFLNCCWLQQKTLELHKPYPFSKLGFPPGRQSLWNRWENSAKRKKKLLNCACSKLY